MKDIQCRQDRQEWSCFVEQLVVKLVARGALRPEDVVDIADSVAEAFEGTDVIPTETQAFANIYRAKLDA